MEEQLRSKIEARITIENNKIAMVKSLHKFGDNHRQQQLHRSHGFVLGLRTALNYMIELEDQK